MTLQELVVKISADTKEFDKKIKGLQTGLNKAAKGMAIAGGVIAGALTLAVKNAAGEEEAQTALAAAMKATRQYTLQAREELTKYAGQLQDTTGVGDEAIQSAMAFGMQMGLSKDQVKALIPHLLDMSAATGVDLQTAMRAAAMATKGQVGMLQRYGVQVKKGKDKTVKFNDLLKAFAGYQGAAQAKGKTLTGQIEIMKAMFSDLTKEIGFVLIPILKEFMEKYIKPLMDKFNALPKPIKENIAKYGALAAVILLVGGAIAKLISSFLGIIGAIKSVMSAVSALVATNPILLMIAGIAAAVLLLYEAWTHDWGGIREKTAAVWKRIKPIFDAIKKVFFFLIGLVKDYINIYVVMWDKVKPIFHHLGLAFKWIGKVVADVFGKIKEWFDKFLGWIKKSIEWVKKLIDKINIFHKKGFEKIAAGTGNAVTGGMGDLIGGTTIPGHAAGGYFTTPHLAWIAERGPEYVIPEDKMKQSTQIEMNINIGSWLGDEKGIEELTMKIADKVDEILGNRNLRRKYYFREEIG